MAAGSVAANALAAGIENKFAANAAANTLFRAVATPRRGRFSPRVLPVCAAAMALHLRPFAGGVPI